MKITEIIQEGRARTGHGKFRKSAENAISDMSSWPGTNNNPYAAYRFGLSMASQPRDNANIEGPIGPEVVTVAYTEAEHEIIQGAAKNMGYTSRNNTGRGSIELDSINYRSPVSARGPIRKPK
jgi:hypothetical protein